MQLRRSYCRLSVNTGDLHDHKGFITHQHTTNITSRKEEEAISSQQRFLWFFTLCMIALSFTIILIPRAVKKSFAVDAYYVGVYWDTKCTNRVTFINWGEISPGATDSVTVFIRNEELAPSCYLALFSRDWDPPSAANYLQLSWNYGNTKISLNSVVRVTLTLKVAPNIAGISDFGFNITIFGTEYIIGDLDHDGDVDLYDLVIIAGSYTSTPSSANWIPEADLNGNNIIDIFDVALLCQNYGKSG